MQTHIVGLIVTIILMAGFALFILWPFVSACRSEGRRIADLLSQLPNDIDVEGLVRRALAGSQPVPSSAVSVSAVSDKRLPTFGSGAGGDAQHTGDSVSHQAGKSRPRAVVIV